MPPLVEPGGPLAAEVVPRRRLVPAPRRQPVGVRHEDHPAGPGDPDHLGEHRAPVPDVLEDVGGEADVDRARGDRQAQRAARHGARPGRAVRGQLAEAGIHAAGPGPGRAQRPGEEARAAPHVDHGLPAKIRVLAKLRNGIRRHQRVKARDGSACSVRNARKRRADRLRPARNPARPAGACPFTTAPRSELERVAVLLAGNPLSTIPFRPRGRRSGGAVSAAAGGRRVPGGW